MPSSLIISLMSHFVDVGPSGISGNTSRFESNNEPVLTTLVHKNLQVFHSRDMGVQSPQGQCVRVLTPANVVATLSASLVGIFSSHPLMYNVKRFSKLF